LKTELETLRAELEALKKHVELMNQLQAETRSLTVFLYSSLRKVEDRHREDEARINYLKKTDNTLLHQQLENQAIKIATLQEKLNKTRDIGRFTRLSPTEEIRPWKEESIRQAMSSMGYLAKQLLYGHDDIINFNPPNIDNNEDLLTLVQKSLGLNSRTSITADTALGWLADFSLQAIVRSLTSAALCEWVFEADIHRTIFTESVLLEEYKDHLRIRGCSP
jgi:hypothetical protein